MSSWNFADLWEVCAGVRGEAPAAVHGDRTISWAEFDRRADGLAAALLDAGLAHQDKVAQYLYNGPEYMQGVYACFKAGWCRSTPTTDTPTTSWSTCGTTPTRRR